jgi:hypothetical protein
MRGSYLGPAYAPGQIRAELDAMGAKYAVLDDDPLFSRTAQLLNEENVIGWFQGHLVSRLAWTLGWGLPFGYTLNPPVAGVVGLDLALARQPVSPAAHLCVPF